MLEANEPRDLELMRRLSAGDEDAFLEFYRRHQGGVYRYALHMTGRPEAADDVVQETFMTLIRHAGKYDEGRGAPAAFLYGVARNHVRKLQEKERRYVSLPGEECGEFVLEKSAARSQSNGNERYAVAPSGTGSVLQGLEEEETILMLRDAILTLPLHYREPVTLCDLQGKSYEDAAALLACPVGTVRSRLNRARSILLEKLRPRRTETRALRAQLGGKP
jgi:RNA polymerase sigma-70 factor (ECF subfamily)